VNKSGRMGFRVNPRDKKKWEEAAHASGLSLSQWVEAWLNRGSLEYERLKKLRNP
jgi:predicted HicB family RNase H-like nuclease